MALKNKTVVAAMVLCSSWHASAQFAPHSATLAAEQARSKRVTEGMANAVTQAVRQELHSGRENSASFGPAPERFRPQTMFKKSVQAPSSFGNPTPAACEYWLAQAELKYGIPPYLLHAVAITESGRNNRPNPFAMNIGGRSYFASSTADMVQIVERNGGGKNIDLGCMQVSLRHHGYKFDNWQRLLDPQTNVEYGAFFLRSLAVELGSWDRAVAAYHSRTSWRGLNYKCLVSRSYGRMFGVDRGAGRCGPALAPMILMVSNYYRSTPRSVASLASSG